MLLASVCVMEPPHARQTGQRPFSGKDQTVRSLGVGGGEASVAVTLWQDSAREQQQQTTRTEEAGCAPAELRLWTSKFEFGTTLMCHELLHFDFSQPCKAVYSSLSSGPTEQVVGWVWPSGCWL